jgi:truncated hemoglobin YjbI
MNPFQTVHDLIGNDNNKLLTHYSYRKVNSNSDLRQLYQEDLTSAEEDSIYFYCMCVVIHKPILNSVAIPT